MKKNLRNTTAGLTALGQVTCKDAENTSCPWVFNKNTVKWMIRKAIPVFSFQVNVTKSWLTLYFSES